ncbi:unnamed protein product [Schistosoma margrebowiei]|uniref:Uncharacterized protein n=1 Tax=Schistosoma margrebowiei TaxID=48269 RepID=A0A183NC61_9TREM|nr:unnamed protein product [Schistosoma margrebowiei]
MNTSTSEGKRGIHWTSKMQLYDLHCDRIARSLSGDPIAIATSNSGENDQCSSRLSSNRSQYKQREMQASPIQHRMHY